MTFNINIRCKERYGDTLGAAAASGKVELVQQLLRLGAEVVPLETDVCSPLIPAVIFECEDVVEFLL